MASLLKDIYQHIVFHVPKKANAALPSVSIVSNAFDKGCRCIFFGEDHHEPRVLEAQCSVLHSMSVLAKQRGDPLYLVMEAFNLEQQQYLDGYVQNKITCDDLISEYSKSEEGFDLHHYRPLIDLARERGAHLRAGFPPRTTAKRAIGGDKGIWEEAQSKGWVNKWNEGSHTHFQWFKSLFSGSEWVPPASFTGKSSLHGNSNNLSTPQQIVAGEPVDDGDSRTKRIFPAQVFKDSVLAESINKILQEDPKAKVLAVCGRGHSDFWLGASERVCEPVYVLSVRSRMREYEDEDERIRLQERTVDDVVQELDERMCDGVFVY